MTTIAIKITLLEPTLVISLGSGDANQQESYGYIPGSVIRNSLAARYISQHKLQENAAQDSKCRQLFFDDRVRFLNAYPAYKNTRTLPTPLSWRMSKQELAEFNEMASGKKQMYDFSQNQADLDSPKLMDKEFCHITNGSAEFVNAKQRVMVHNARTTRRVLSKNTGSVFQYQALDAGESFIGLIQIDDELDVEATKSKLTNFSGEMSIGKSRSAGYGRVKIEDITNRVDRDKWQEPTWAKEEGGDSDTIVITLLSDALVRDENGSYTTDISHLVCKPTDNDKPKFERAYHKTSLIGGFNRKWGLPLPQVQAIAKGSVYVFKRDVVDFAKLERCYTQGIGERLGEGFGRIAVDWYIRDTITAMKYQEHKLRSEVTLHPDKHNQAYKLAQRIIQSQLQRKLDQALLTKIANLTITSAPSKSQLSRVRLAARKALEHKNMAQIRSFLQSVRGDDVDTEGNTLKKGNGSKKAYKELTRSRIEGKPLFEWLMDYATNPDLIEQTLSPDSTYSFGGVSAEFTDELKIEYTARQIEGIVKRKLDQLRKENSDDQ